MSEDGPAPTRWAVGGDGADVAPSPARRPFACPTPANGGQPTAALRPIPFIAPAEPGRKGAAHLPRAENDAGATTGGEAAGTVTEPHVTARAARGTDAADAATRGTGWCGPAAAMTWPEPREVQAALALESLAGRLRAGRLHLPVTVHPACVPAIVAAVLAAVHAEDARTFAATTAGPVA